MSSKMLLPRIDNSARFVISPKNPQRLPGSTGNLRVGTLTYNDGGGFEQARAVYTTDSHLAASVGMLNVNKNNPLFVRNGAWLIARSTVKAGSFPHLKVGDIITSARLGVNRSGVAAEAEDYLSSDKNQVNATCVLLRLPASALGLTDSVEANTDVLFLAGLRCMNINSTTTDVSFRSYLTGYTESYIHGVILQLRAGIAEGIYEDDMASGGKSTGKQLLLRTQSADDTTRYPVRVGDTIYVKVRGYEKSVRALVYAVKFDDNGKATSLYLAPEEGLFDANGKEFDFRTAVAIKDIKASKSLIIGKPLAESEGVEQSPARRASEFVALIIAAPLATLWSKLWPKN